MSRFSEPTVRIEDDKVGNGCHVVINPNEYGPTVQVRFESHDEADQWLSREFLDWYRLYRSAHRRLANDETIHSTMVSAASD